MIVVFRNGKVAINDNGTVKVADSSPLPSGCCCNNITCASCTPGTATQYLGVTISGIVESIGGDCLCADLVEGIEFEIALDPNTECSYGPQEYRFDCPDGHFISLEISAIYDNETIRVDVFILANIAAGFFSGDFEWALSIDPAPFDCGVERELPFSNGSASFGSFCNVTSSTIILRPYN